MSAKDVMDYIFQANTNELTELREAITQRNNRLTRTFRVGEDVEFDPRPGVTIRGKIIKVNTKTVKVLAESNDNIWSVAGSFLRRSPKPV